MERIAYSGTGGVFGGRAGFIFGGNTYAARAEETSMESPQESAESPVSDDNSAGEETPEEDIGFDLDAFLEWVQKYADEAGIGGRIREGGGGD